jgi:hypothetical protein
MKDFREVELFAWIGEDEFGSGEIGLKQGIVPAGCIPLVAVKREKMASPQIVNAMQAQAAQYGKKIRLVRCVFAEVVLETDKGR